MSTAPPTPSPPGNGSYVRMQESEDFAELRRRFRTFAFPVTIGFTAWYLLYVLLSNYAGDFMAKKLFGNINVAFVLGLAQFLTTFLIAWWYARHANAKFDPEADRLRAVVEADVEHASEDAR
ncbi:hypothetical protein SRB5_15130 [Streptomyces sp. RB5]|uniref:DUF485 domain-containing protein n=1 Tax=Streptomyces smaragdinus TaxID=2585196 RepID=A0A7K0CD49_9ACTN|nr:DUF485 domain-containing protein [Streptomyces smaragdinus]MQY11397.1 hypothetical protein [Streptomyces smaragdinus]